MWGRSALQLLGPTCSGSSNAARSTRFEYTRVVQRTMVGRGSGATQAATSGRERGPGQSHPLPCFERMQSRLLGYRATRTSHNAGFDTDRRPSAPSGKELEMTSAKFAALGTPTQDDYRAGACNIGPAEIARRRQAGHVGLAMTIALFVGLVAIGAPQPVRLLVALPAAGAASGYLQAFLHFCAAFGSLGRYNFGSLGKEQLVTDPVARALDRLTSARIGIAAVAIGAAVGLIAALLPLR